MSIDQVKSVRAATGAGVAAVKAALDAAHGNEAQAVAALRASGAAKALGRVQAGATAREGVILHAGTALVRVSCETDFVAKGDRFLELASRVAELADAIGPGADVRLATLDGVPVRDVLLEASAAMGETIAVTGVEHLRLPRGERVAAYLHSTTPGLPARRGALLAFSGDDSSAARRAAQQVVALRAAWVRRADVPASVVASETAVGQLKAAGRPAHVQAQVVAGHLEAFYRDAVLLEQPSTRDETGRRTVGDDLRDAGVGVTALVHLELP